MKPHALLLIGVILAAVLAGSAFPPHPLSPDGARGAGGGPMAEPFDEDRFEKEVLVPACTDPMEIDVLPDRRILWIDRKGNLKMWSPAKRQVQLLGNVPTDVFGEVGMLRMAADRSKPHTRGHRIRCPLSSPPSGRPVLGLF
jgi:hypothetical protein